MKFTITSLADRRLWFVLLLGFCSGFPWAVTGSLMTQFLFEQSLSRSIIGAFGAIAIVYACNFLWAPLVDGVRFGISRHKRSDWLIGCLVLQALATCLLAYWLPVASVAFIALLVFCIIISSATQDVAIDAWRIELMKVDEQQKISLGATMATIGWWSGYAIPAAIFLYMSDLALLTWDEIYYCLAAWFFVLATSIWLASAHFMPQHAQLSKTTKSSAPTMAQQCKKYLLMPFLYFMQRYGAMALMLLVFIFTFKLGEAFLGRMSLTFYNEVGFSKSAIATYSKLIGWGTTIVFALVAGLIMIQFGIIRGLVIGGIAMASTNLMFAWIAAVGPNETLFFWTIVCDNFTSAFATVAFVAFLSYLCGRESTATEYALLASIGNFGRTSLSGFSGFMIDMLDGNWVLFFIITALMVIPSLLLLVYITPRLSSLRKQ